MRKKLTQFQTQIAAYLYSENWSQAQIADRLRLSQSVVSRAIKQAKKDGLLEESRPRFNEEQLSKEQVQQIKSQLEPQELKNQLKGLAESNGIGYTPVVRVFPSGYFTPAPSTLNKRLAEFARLTAPYVTELLRSASIVGVAWGNVLGHLVKAIKDGTPESPRRKSGITFVPLCGEPLGKAATPLSASSLAAELHRITNGTSNYSHSLAVVPAIIPNDFTEKETAAIRKLIARVDAYRDIFGGNDNGRSRSTPLIDKLDTVLTSVGSSKTALGYTGDELVQRAGLDRTVLRNLLIGDIGGVLIPNPQLDASGIALIKKITDRWTGVTERHLKRCAQNAANNQTPGVIVSAIGREKAAVVCECIKRGLVNQLLIDQDLKNDLEQIVEL